MRPDSCRRLGSVIKATTRSQRSCGTSAGQSAGSSSSSGWPRWKMRSAALAGRIAIFRTLERAHAVPVGFARSRFLALKFRDAPGAGTPRAFRSLRMLVRCRRPGRGR